jgi:hypothetical protein
VICREKSSSKKYSSCVTAFSLTQWVMSGKQGTENNHDISILVSKVGDATKYLCYIAEVCCGEVCMLHVYVVYGSVGLLLKYDLSMM